MSRYAVVNATTALDRCQYLGMSAGLLVNWSLPWHHGQVQLSEFWQSMDQVFGANYARSLAVDLVVSGLGGRTTAQALADGVAPRDIWVALCDAMEVPESKRWLWQADSPANPHPRNRGY